MSTLSNLEIFLIAAMIYRQKRVG